VNAQELQPPIRLLRALIAASAATIIGAASHVTSGGALSVAGAACAVPVLVALAWPLTYRERGWLPILGVQLAGQLAAHALFASRTAEHASSGVPVDAWFYGHVLAAVVLTAWLRCGERRTWAAARRAGRALSTYLCRLLTLFEQRDAPHPDVPPPVDRPLTPSCHPLRHSLVRRGPPLPA
jgi:hypothetical protein